MLAVRRMVRAFPRLDPAFRRNVVSSIDSQSVRDYYDQRLSAEGDADVAGVVERYPFAASDRLEQTRWYWTVIAVAGLALASPLLVPRMAAWQRAIAYGLAEVHPDGTRRTLTFNQPLALRVNRWRSRMEIMPVRARRRNRIFLDFDRLGSIGCS